MNLILTYQQIRLLEQVANSRREGRKYLIAPIEKLDAQVCIKHGLLEIQGDVAILTTAGSLYIIELNTSR